MKKFLRFFALLSTFLRSFKIWLSVWDTSNDWFKPVNGEFFLHLRNYSRLLNNFSPNALNSWRNVNTRSLFIELISWQFTKGKFFHLLLRLFFRCDIKMMKISLRCKHSKTQVALCHPRLKQKWKPVFITLVSPKFGRWRDANWISLFFLLSGLHTVFFLLTSKLFSMSLS